jgi:hypothetical protein
LIAALLVAAGSLPSFAQQSALEPPPLERYLRWGPLRVRPGIELKNVGHDDNIFASNANPVSDVTATLAPRAEGLVLFGHRGFLTFREEVGYTLYRQNSDQNYLDQRGTARMTLPFRSMGVFVEGLYNELKERPLDEQDVRADRDETGLGAGLIWQLGWRSEIELGQSRKELDYFDEDADPLAPVTIGEQLDRTERRNTLELRYRVAGRTRLTLFALYNTIEFDSSVSSGRDAREISLLPGVDFGRGGRLSGTLRVGLTEIDARDPTRLDFEELSGRARLSYRPLSRLTFHLDGRREPGFTLSSAGIFYLNTTARLGGVYYLNRLIGIEAAGTIGRLDFPVAGAAVEREDDLTGYEAGVRLRLAENSLGRRVEYSLRLRRSRRDSNFDSQDRSQTTFGLNAVVGF